MVEAKLSLVPTITVGQNGHQKAARIDLRDVGRYVLVHQIHSDRVLTGNGNGRIPAAVLRKDRRPWGWIVCRIGWIWNRATAVGYGLSATWTSLQHGGHKWVCNRSIEGSGEHSRTFGSRRQDHRTTGNSPNAAKSLIGTKEERAVLADRPPPSPTKLVLNERLFHRIEVILRVQRLVAMKFVEITVNAIGSGLRNHIHYRT